MIPTTNVRRADYELETRAAIYRSSGVTVAASTGEVLLLLSFLLLHPILGACVATKVANHSEWNLTRRLHYSQCVLMSIASIRHGV